MKATSLAWKTCRRCMKGHYRKGSRWFAWMKNRWCCMPTSVLGGPCARDELPGATGYAISLSRRWLVEKGFGWLTQTGPLRQVKLRGLEKVDWLFVFSCAAHNLIRFQK